MTIHLAKFLDFGLISRQVSMLAASEFAEEGWRPHFETFNWQVIQDPHYKRHSIIINERRDLFRNNEQLDPAMEPDALVRFNAPEFSMPLAHTEDERLSHARTRSKFVDTFADLQNSACAALGEPSQRLHYVIEGLEPAVFCACVWSSGANDLYLLQDVGDLSIGIEGQVEFRILPARPEGIRLPHRSAFSC